MIAISALCFTPLSTCARSDEQGFRTHWGQIHLVVHTHNLPGLWKTRDRGKYGIIFRLKPCGRSLFILIYRSEVFTFISFQKTCFTCEAELSVVLNCQGLDRKWLYWLSKTAAVEKCVYWRENYCTQVFLLWLLIKLIGYAFNPREMWEQIRDAVEEKTLWRFCCALHTQTHWDWIDFVTYRFQRQQAQCRCALTVT